jgi:AcrR family transcriptional regulator
MDNSANIREQTSRKKLVEAGKVLIFKYGYRKVTVEEICKAAAISKMTFYRFFKNKMDLVNFIMTEIADEGWARYQEIRNRDISFEDKIRSTVQMKYEAAEQYSDDLLKDIYSDPDTSLMTFLQKLSAETMAQVMEDYKLAQEQGHIRKDLNLDFIPYFLNQINNLVNDPVLLGLYNGNLREVMKELTNFFFYGILVPNTQTPDEK